MTDSVGTSLRSSKPGFFKIVLLGEGAVGKSSILLRYTQNKFIENHESTIQAAFAAKKVNVDGNEIELNIWDTAGANGAILVFDITDPHSFQRVRNWVTELKMMLGNTCSLFIVGNKIDLEPKRNVPKEEAEEFAKSVDSQFIECSAKNNIGIEQLFDELTRTMIKNDAILVDEKLKRNPSLRRQGSRRQIRVQDEPTTPPNRKCC